MASNPMEAVLAAMMQMYSGGAQAAPQVGEPPPSEPAPAAPAQPTAEPSIEPTPPVTPEAAPAQPEPEAAPAAASPATETPAAAPAAEPKPSDEEQDIKEILSLYDLKEEDLVDPEQLKRLQKQAQGDIPLHHALAMVGYAMTNPELYARLRLQEEAGQEKAEEQLGEITRTRTSMKKEGYRQAAIVRAQRRTERTAQGKLDEQSYMLRSKAANDTFNDMRRDNIPPETVGVRPPDEATLRDPNKYAQWVIDTNTKLSRYQGKQKFFQDLASGKYSKANLGEGVDPREAILGVARGLDLTPEDMQHVEGFVARAGEAAKRQVEYKNALIERLGQLDRESEGRLKNLEAEHQRKVEALQGKVQPKDAGWLLANTEKRLTELMNQKARFEYYVNIYTNGGMDKNGNEIKPNPQLASQYQMNVMEVINRISQTEQQRKDYEFQVRTGLTPQIDPIRSFQAAAPAISTTLLGRTASGQIPGASPMAQEAARLGGPAWDTYLKTADPAKDPVAKAFWSAIIFRMMAEANVQDPTQLINALNQPIVPGATPIADQWAGRDITVPPAAGQEAQVLMQQQRQPIATPGTPP